MGTPLTARTDGTNSNLHEVRGAYSAQPLTCDLAAALCHCGNTPYPTPASRHLETALRLELLKPNSADFFKDGIYLVLSHYSFFNSFFKRGDVVVQEDTGDITLYHEGFFWRCSFGGNVGDDNLLWKLWFSK